MLQGWGPPGEGFWGVGVGQTGGQWWEEQGGRGEVQMVQKELLGERGDNYSLEQSLAAPGARSLPELDCLKWSIFKKLRGIRASAWLGKAAAVAPSSFSFPCPSVTLQEPIAGGPWTQRVGG